MPTIEFVFGSSGGGKTTRLVPRLKMELNNPYVLEIDDIKRLLPAELSNTKKNKLKNQMFFNKLDNMLNQHNDIIVSYPYLMMVPRRIKKLLKSARGHGYDTHASFLATDYKWARQGIDHRYIRTLQGDDTGEMLRRLRPLRAWALHVMVPVTLWMLKHCPQINTIRLFNRDGMELPDNTIKTFLSEQSRPYTHAETEIFNIRAKEIADFKKNHRKLFYQRLYQ